jgi:hypothetical protein
VLLCCFTIFLSTLSNLTLTLGMQYGHIIKLTKSGSVERPEFLLLLSVARIHNSDLVSSTIKFYHRLSKHPDLLAACWDYLLSSPPASQVLSHCSNL